MGAARAPLGRRTATRYRVGVQGASRAAGLAPGTRLGRYTLLRRFAMGGMAELYLAQQHGAAGFTKVVALKRILPHLAEDPKFTRMFLAEARLASGLVHPNLAHVLDFGEYEGEHFLTMEYVHGRNLLHLLSEGDEPIPLGAGLAVVSAVARGLHDLHEQSSPEGRSLGLVHRDVSPSNVLVSYDGTVKLTDFGIAKAMGLTSATMTGAFKGKLGHASPEQVRGEEIDRRSDVFCLGILLYEVTTGVRAFTAPNEFAVLAKVARGQYAPLSEIDPDYPVALAKICERAMQAAPGDRFPTAAAMAQAIDAFARHRGLALSEEGVAAAMVDAFGEAPPIIDAAELELSSRVDMSAVQDSSASATPVPITEVRQRGRGRGALALFGALSLGAVGAWSVQAAMSTEDPPPASVSPSKGVEVAPDPEPAPPGANVEPPVAVAKPPASLLPASREHDAAGGDKPDPDSPADVAELEPVRPPASAPAKGKRKRPKAKKGGRAKKKSSASATPMLDALYPPE